MRKLLFVVLVIFSCFSLFAEKENISKYPNLLIKIYARNNPEMFFVTLNQFYKNLSYNIPFHFLIAYDEDDLKMNNQQVQSTLQKYPHLTVVLNKSKSIADAYNLGIDQFIDWFDVLLVVDDDYLPVVNCYDEIIINTMISHFPKYDGVLNFYDQPNIGINRFPIIGQHFYKRFGCVFYSQYSSSKFDEEFTCISRILGREMPIKKAVLAKTSSSIKVSNKDDEKLFLQRRSQNFDLKNACIEETFIKDWSILICTLDEREKQFSQLYKKLMDQIYSLKLEEKVEVLFHRDNRELSIGHKRNELVRRSRGKYISFIDDDDEINENYVKIIHEKLKKSPDCVSLCGIITFNGYYPATFIHSIKYNSYFQANGIYYRPPNHLNPIKRSVGAQFLFPNISYTEDTNWAMQIARSGLLKVEEEVFIPYYFYNYVTNK